MYQIFVLKRHNLYPAVLYNETDLIISENSFESKDNALAVLNSSHSIQYREGQNAHRMTQALRGRGQAKIVILEVFDF